MINSPARDYSPAFVDKKNSTLDFTSTREGTTGGLNKDGTTGDLHSDIFETKLGKDGKWSTPTPLPEPINTPDNEGTAIVDRKGTFMIFTRCGEAKKKKITCQLLISKKSGPNWGAPEPLPFDDIPLEHDDHP